MFESLKYLWREAGSRRWLFLIGVVVVFGAILFDVGWIPLPGRILDRVLEEKSVAHVPRGIAMILMFAAGAAILLYAQRKIIIGVSRHVEYQMRMKFFAHLQKLSSSFYDKHPVGDTTSRISNDLGYVRELFGAGILHALQTTISIVLILVFMLLTSWKLTLIAIVPFVLLPVFTRSLILMIRKRELEARTVMGNLSNFIQENFSAIQILKNYCAEPQRLSRFEDTNKKLLGINMKIAVIHAGLHSVLQFLARLGMIFLLLGGGIMIIRNMLTPGGLLTMILLLGKLMWPVIGFGWVLTLFQRGIAGLQRLQEIFDEKPDFNEDELTMPGWEDGEGIRVSSLDFTYPGRDETVLKKINMEIKSGQTAAIVGPTGCGKTTLIRLLSRHYRVPDKSIRLWGVDINQVPLRELRKRMSMVPQEPFLFSETISYNVGYGERDFTETQINAGLEKARIGEEVGEFPEKAETMLGEKGINLSGGQKQRLTLARAFIQEPDLLILDDCLSAVDADTETTMLNTLKDIRRNRTVIIVSPRIAAVMDADVIFYMEHGEIVERGTHNELLNKNGGYTRMVRRQMLAMELEKI